MNEKTIDLNLDFNNLPKEMQDVSLRLRAAVLRLRKAEKQAMVWSNELSMSRTEWEQAQKQYGLTSLRWNPGDNSMSPMEEL